MTSTLSRTEPDRLTLRPYQQDAVDEITTGLADATARLLFVLAPGAGKTEVAIGSAARILEQDPEARFLVLTHRNVLIEQTARRFRRWGIPATAATSRAWRPSDPLPETTAVVMSPGTAQSRNVLGMLEGGHWHLIVDEAHHAPAASWRRLIVEFPGPGLGLTGTPWRLDRTEHLADTFNRMILGPQPDALIRGGYLAEPIVMAAKPENRISGGRRSRGDFTASGIMEANDRVVLTDRAIDWWLDVTGGEKQTIIYAVSRTHALNLKDCLEERGISAAVVLSDTPEAERERVGQAFTAATFRCLINVAIYTEGADFKEADCIMLLRPTESLALYLQEACRGMRYNDGNRTLIMDATDNTAKHGLPAQTREWSLNARGSGGSGGEPVKTCPDCDVMTGMRMRECPECGYAYGDDCIQCGRWQPWSKWAQQADVCDECKRDRGFDFDEQMGVILEDGWGRSQRGHPFLTRRDQRATLVRKDRGENGYIMYLEGANSSRRRDLGAVTEGEAKAAAEKALNMRAAVMKKRIRSCRAVIDSAATLTNPETKNRMLDEAGEAARTIRADIETLGKSRDRAAVEKLYDELVTAGRQARTELALL